MIHCPQCGYPTNQDDFCEGYCLDCWEQNQNQMDMYNLAID